MTSEASPAPAKPFSTTLVDAAMKRMDRAQELLRQAFADVLEEAGVLEKDYARLKDYATEVAADRARLLTVIVEKDAEIARLRELTK